MTLYTTYARLFRRRFEKNIICILRAAEKPPRAAQRGKNNNIKKKIKLRLLPVTNYVFFHLPPPPVPVSPCMLQYYNNGHNKSHRRDLKCTSFFLVAHLFTLYCSIYTYYTHNVRMYIIFSRGPPSSGG